MMLATDFLSVMNFWLPNEALTSSSHLRESATDFLSAMDSDLEQSPYIVGDGFLISNEFFWLPNEALTSSSHLRESATDFLSAMNFLVA